VQPYQASSPASVRQSALLAQCSNGVVRAFGFDPSPGRASSRAAVIIGSDYGYLNLQRDQVANSDQLASLSIPANILDNRVVRPRTLSPELSLADAMHHSADPLEVQVCSALMHPELMPQVMRELHSPRYRVAPDFYARRVSFGPGSLANMPGTQRAPFGMLSDCGRFYWLDRAGIDAMTQKLHSPLALAKLLVSIWPQLLDCEWAQLWLDQRQLSFACQSSLSYDWLWSELPSVQTSMSIYLDVNDSAAEQSKGAIVDAQQREIDSLMMIRGAIV
jgi:hypothetical protein